MYVKMFDFAWLVFEASFISHGFVVGFVLLITGLVFWFGFKAPEEPSFKGLSASSASKTTPKKSNKKKTQSNGEIVTDSASLNRQKSKPKQTVKTSSVLKDTKSLHTAERSQSSIGKQTPVSESKEGSKQSSNEKSISKSRGKAEDDGWESVSRKEKKIKKQTSDEPTKTESPKERKKREVLINGGGSGNGEKSNQVMTLSKQPDGTKIKATHTKNVEKSPSTKVSNSKGKTLPETNGKNKSNKVGKKEVKNHSTAVANHESSKGSGDGADGEDEEEDSKREKQQQRSKKLPSKEIDNKAKSGKENNKNASSTIAVEKNNDGKLKVNRKLADDEAAAKGVVDENLPVVATAASELATNGKKSESGDKTNAKKSTGKSKVNEKPDQETRKEEAIITAKKVESRQSAQPITTADDAEKRGKTKTPTIKSEKVAADSAAEKRSNKSAKKDVNEVATKEKTPLMPANSNEKPKLSNSKRKRQESSDKNGAEETIDEFADKEITTIIVTNTNYKVEEGEEGEEEKENSKKSKFDKTKGGDRTAQSKLGNRNNSSKKVAGKSRNQEIVNGSNNNNSKPETSPIDEDSSWKEAKANKKKKKPIKEP